MLTYALSSTAATSTRKDRQWESAMDAALADPNHDNWVTVSTAHVNTKTTAIINEPSSSASTGAAASASGQDRDFFNPHTVEHLSVTGKTAEQGPSDGSADIVTEDEMPPCPDGADCPESESKASNLAANPAANPGTMETEATAVAQTEASKATNDATANGKTIISSADAKNDMKGPEKPVRNGNNDQEIQFSPEPEDGNAPPARTSATGNATGNAGAQPHKAPKFLHDIMHRHKKRHARLLDIKNKAAAFKKEIHAIKKAHEKDKQLLAAHKKTSGGKMAGHVQKHEQDVVKMGKEINQILKIVQGMANQMKPQTQDQSAAATPAAEDEDAEEDAEKDVEKDATANEDAAAAKEEEAEDAEEDADDQAAAKAEEKQDKVDEESEDKDEGESRIFLCILCVCVFYVFVCLCVLSSRLTPNCMPLSGVCIVVRKCLTFSFPPVNNCHVNTEEASASGSAAADKEDEDEEEDGKWVVALAWWTLDVGSTPCFPSKCTLF